MEKNQGGKWVVFAFDVTDNTAVTGDAANITANVRIDGGAANAVDDTNPTELEDGYYIFDITAAESNGDLLLICPASSTGDVQVIGVPGTIYTTPPNFNAMGIESDGDLTKVNTLDGHTAQTGDNYARLGAPAGASIAADIATVDGVADDILTDTGTTIPATLSTIESKVDTADAAVDAVQADVTNILADTDELQTNQGDWATATGFATSGALATVDANVDSILTDTGTTLPATLSTIDGKIDTVDGVVDSILVDTAEIGAAGAGLTAVPWNASWDAEVQSEVTDALNAYDPPTKAELDSGFSALNDLSAAEVNAEVDTALADYDGPTKTEMDSAFTEIKGATFSGATDSLEAIRDRGDAAWTTGAGGSAPTAADIRAEIDSNSTQLAAILTDTGTTIPATLSTIDGKVDTVDTVVDGIQTDLSNGTDGLGAIKGAVDGLNDLSAADVNAEVDTALSDIHLDHLFATAYDATSKPGASDALLNEMVEDDSGVTRYTVNALENGPSGSGASAASIADAVWTEALADHSGVSGSTAEALDGASAGGGLDAAGVRAAVGLASANLDTQLSTIDGNVDSVLTDTGTTLPATLSTIEGKVDTADAAVDAVQSDVTAILADTDELQTNQGDWATATGFATSAALATVDSNVDAVLVDTGTTIPASISALNDLSAADVNAEVDTALSDYDGPTKAELDAGLAALNDLSAADVTGAVPTATENADALLNRDMSAVSDTNSRSPLNALRAVRNKVSISGGTATVTKEDDATSAWTSAITTDAAADNITESDPA